MTTIGLSYSLVKRSTKCAPALTIGQYEQSHLVTSPFPRVIHFFNGEGVAAC